MVQKLVYWSLFLSNILDRNMTISDFIMKKKKMTFLRSYSQIQLSLFPAWSYFSLMHSNILYADTLKILI